MTQEDVAMVVWTQSLAIGNALIDAQQKTLFERASMLLVLLGFLESWLTDHVTKSDRRIADHMRQ